MYQGMTSLLTSLALLKTQEKWLVATHFLVGSFQAFLDLAGIFGIGIVVYAFSQDQRFVSSNPAGQFNEIPEVELPFLWAIGLVVAIYLLKMFVSIMNTRGMSNFFAKVETRVAGEIANHLFRIDYKKLPNRSPSEIYWNLNLGTSILVSWNLFHGMTIALEGLVFLTILSALLFVDVISTLILLGFIILVATLIQRISVTKLEKAGQDFADYSLALHASVMETLDVFAEATVLGRIRTFIERIHNYRGTLSTSDSQIRVWSALPRTVLEGSIVVAAMLLIGALSTSSSGAGGIVIVTIFLVGGVRLMGAVIPAQRSLSEIISKAPQATRAATVFLDDSARQQ